MKKSIVTLALLLLCCANLSAQQRGIRCTYEFNYTRDTTLTDLKHNDVIVLCRGENSSVSYSQYTRKCDSLMMADGGSGDVYLQHFNLAIAAGNVGSVCKRATYYVFKDFKEQKMSVVDNIQSDKFIYDDTSFGQQWELADSTKVIGGYHCNLASCLFRGREWSAWYTTEIPVSDGPWKFAGLPGLILEVYDRQPQYVFSLISLTTTEDSDTPTIKELCGKRMKKTERKRYLRAQMEMLKDLGGFLAASLPIHIDGVTESNPKTIMYDLLERDYNEK